MLQIRKYWLPDGSLVINGFCFEPNTRPKTPHPSPHFPRSPILPSLWKGCHRKLDVLLTHQTGVVHHIIVPDSRRSHVESRGESFGNEDTQASWGPRAASPQCCPIVRTWGSTSKGRKKQALQKRSNKKERGEVIARRRPSDGSWFETRRDFTTKLVETPRTCLYRLSVHNEKHFPCCSVV